MGKVELLIRSIKKRGLLKTLCYAIYEISFDWIYNTDTKPEIANYDPANDSPASFAGPYLGANPLLVERCIRKCRQFGLEIRNASFLDIGSGKGRVILLASLAGFDSVIGVEIDPALCRVAKRNLDVNRARISSRVYEICNSDAACYEYPDSLNVVFIYNSFGVLILRKVLELLIRKYKGRSHDKQRTPLYLIYLNPVYARVFGEFGMVPCCDVDNEALIYRIE